LGVDACIRVEEIEFVDRFAVFTTDDKTDLVDDGVVSVVEEGSQGFLLLLKSLSEDLLPPL
jgi:hypothetical protein